MVSPDTGPTLPPPENDLGLEAWLDEPVTIDAPAGASVRVGAFIWSSREAQPVHNVTLRVRLHPASGGAQPSVAYAVEDWPGHVVAELPAPVGGVGELEILLPGTMCDATGCSPQDTSIPISGVGPPTGVPLTAIASAVIEPPVEALFAGAPAIFGVTVQPRIAWPPPGVPLPSSIWLQVRVPQGPTLDDVAAPLVDMSAGRFAADVTFDRAGELIVQVGVIEGAEGTDLFSTAVRRVTVEAGSAPTPAGGGAGGGETMPGWAVVTIAVLLVGGLGLVVLGQPRGPTRRG